MTNQELKSSKNVIQRDGAKILKSQNKKPLWQDSSMGIFHLFSMSFAGSMWYAYRASTWGRESLFQVPEWHGYVIQPLLRAFTL